MIKSQRHFLEAGFTLVELLVAIAVLAIIVVAAAQILGTTSTLTTVNNKHMDANDQARAVFDRMADDFARMVRRKDVDFIFWKAAVNGTGDTGGNDAMFFYTEGSSYFDTTTFNASGGGIPAGASNNSEKSAPSLVGYRVNTVSTSPDYNQLERLGKALSWDGGAYNSTQPATNSKQPNFVVFLTYPPAGTDVHTLGSPDSTVAYSTAFLNSTLMGAYANNSAGPRSLTTTPTTVGTEGNNFNNGVDTSYHSIGSQVFRFEYAFQLKDGTVSDKPMMVQSATNGVPSSKVTGAQRPLPTNDSTSGGGSWSIGSRWWDSTNHIGYICLDATPSNAIWHEIGIQDVAAIVVTIAVIDKQGLTYTKNSGIDLKNVASQLPDYVATTTTSTVTGDPSYLLNPSQATGWAKALLPGGLATTMTAPKLPQEMVSQIRLYQRYFYLNNF
jgi:prepilin-type N-terminal cleavage/methylation domain-containing protein